MHVTSQQDLTSLLTGSESVVHSWGGFACQGACGNLWRRFVGHMWEPATGASWVRQRIIWPPNASSAEVEKP